jgi:hypothetical protein
MIDNIKMTIPCYCDAVVPCREVVPKRALLLAALRVCTSYG